MPPGKSGCAWQNITSWPGAWQSLRPHTNRRAAICWRAWRCSRNTLPASTVRSGRSFQGDCSLRVYVRQLYRGSGNPGYRSFASPDPLEKADLYMLKNICHTGLGQYEAAVKEGLAGLRELGINIPLKPHFLSFLGNYFRIGCLVHKRAFRNSFISPEQADPRPLKEMELLISLFAPSYHLPTLLFPSLILKLVELSLKYPNLKYAPIAVGSYAQVAAFMFGTGNTVYRWGKDTLDLLKTSSYPSVRGRYIYAFTFLSITGWPTKKRASASWNRFLMMPLLPGIVFTPDMLSAD